MNLKKGNKYVWKHDRSQTLVYKGKSGSWHQFSKEDSEGIWCEVLTSDLNLMEPL